MFRAKSADAAGRTDHAVIMRARLREAGNYPESYRELSKGIKRVSDSVL